MRKLLRCHALLPLFLFVLAGAATTIQATSPPAFSNNHTHHEQTAIHGIYHNFTRFLVAVNQSSNPLRRGLFTKNNAKRYNSGATLDPGDQAQQQSLKTARTAGETDRRITEKNGNLNSKNLNEIETNDMLYHIRRDIQNLNSSIMNAGSKDHIINVSQVKELRRIYQNVRRYLTATPVAARSRQSRTFIKTLNWLYGYNLGRPWYYDYGYSYQNAGAISAANSLNFLGKMFNMAWSISYGVPNRPPQCGQACCYSCCGPCCWSCYYNYDHNHNHNLCQDGVVAQGDVGASALKPIRPSFSNQTPIRPSFPNQTPIRPSFPNQPPIRPGFTGPFAQAAVVQGDPPLTNTFTSFQTVTPNSGLPTTVREAATTTINTDEVDTVPATSTSLASNKKRRVHAYSKPEHSVTPDKQLVKPQLGFFNADYETQGANDESSFYTKLTNTANSGADVYAKPVKVSRPKTDQSNPAYIRTEKPKIRLTPHEPPSNEKLDGGTRTRPREPKPISTNVNSYYQAFTSPHPPPSLQEYELMKVEKGTSQEELNEQELTQGEGNDKGQIDYDSGWIPVIPQQHHNQEITSTNLSGNSNLDKKVTVENGGELSTHDVNYPSTENDDAENDPDDDADDYFNDAAYDEEEASLPPPRVATIAPPVVRTYPVKDASQHRPDDKSLDDDKEDDGPSVQHLKSRLLFGLPEKFHGLAKISKLSF